MEKKLRLVQVAREFKVGLGTITEFLSKKGITDVAPNTLVDSDVYALLEKEFGGNRLGGERDNIRERINLKQESVSLHDRKDAPAQTESFKEEVVIKSTTVAPAATTVATPTAAPTTRVEVGGPKVLGKIDLEPKKTAPAEQAKQPEVKAAGEQPAAPVKEEKKIEEPKVEAPKVEKVTVEEKPKVEAAPAPAKPKVESKPAPAKPVAPKVEEKAPVASQEAQTKTYDERVAESKDVFRVESTELSGPKVLGKIDIDSFRKGGDSHREKRKRIKDKVDVNKPQQGGGKQQGGKPQQGGGQQQGQPTSKKDKKNKQKNAPKPVVRPEVSDEEVQKQIKDTLARLTSKGAKSKGSVYRKEKRQAVAERMEAEFEQSMSESKVLKLTEFVTVSDLATMMSVGVTDVITTCMNLGLMVSINQRLDAEALVIVAEEYGFKVEFVSVDIQEAIEEAADKEEDLMERPPIVTVMGHVDHGKTSLLDNIRKTNVIAGEAGGITQHIGAYSVKYEGKTITFLDTPGHEAFTAMRARGAQVTDVAIIIVAADDRVMPQTVEAINHAVAAGVPMVFAINKIDKPAANPEMIKEQLANMNYLVEDWGGKYQSQEISAKQGINLDKLLEKVLLEAELLDLKANPNKKAVGTVIESSLDKGRGYVATILVESGTLRTGDVILSGTHTGRVKAMFNEHGKKVAEAGPSTPVLVLGLNGAPQAGDKFNVMDDDRSAREIATKREQLQRIQGIKTQKHVTLDEIGRRIAIGNFKELNIIVKGDVDGSIEAMTDSLLKLSTETVQVNVIHKAVGQITEGDVLLAAASNAVIVGFQVRPSAGARKIAENESIEIRLYSIIYDAINDIKDAIEGMLEPEMKEEIMGTVEVLETFKISKVGTIAGGIVREGKITRTSPVRVIRDGIVIFTGRLGSLKRFKDDVKEVTLNMECGLNIESYNDIKVGDIIESYDQVEVKKK
ncbi:MAG: translation initiation factor IF-2 [Tidjanibacter sp.]|nr:translation initiation factor IF-2 [Tidjanibacter sp.]